MKYRTAYTRFIAKAKTRMKGIDSKRKLFEVQSEEKLEVHHVLPKQMGGSNQLQNLVLLTHAEHIYAHFLLNLALAQENNLQKLFSLGYTDMPVNLLDMVKSKRNVFRGLKIDLFTSGKKHAPNTISIIDAAKVLCILGRRNFDNQLVLAEEVRLAVRLAIFHSSKFGYKMKLHF